MSAAEELVPLSNLWFHILLALGAGDAHGYAIGKEVEARSGGKLNPTTGGLYQALRRLEEEGLVAPAEGNGEHTDKRRRTFQLTELGREVIALEAARLDGLVEAARARDLFVKSSDA